MMTAEQKLGLKVGVIFVLALIAVVVFLVINPLVMIKAGERGVILKWGAGQEEILDEGIHWVFPIMKKVKKMDVTTQKEESKASASSKDMQVVSTQVAINYYLDYEKVNRIYQTLKYDYSQRVINPAIQEYVKKVTAQYNAEELITKREDVKSNLLSALVENLHARGIIVEDLFITDFDFSKEFNTAIERKVTAEQNALEQRNKLEQVKYEAQQKIETALAEAKAIKIKAEAITQQGGKDYVALQAVDKWDGVLPKQMIPQGALPFINVALEK
jgi:regulator of protease activity HflC (stomatin/prohibitin superfamily)